MTPPANHAIPVQRRAALLAIVRDRGAVSVGGLAAMIGVSGSTIRRDLSALEQRGLLNRSHGGAVLSDPAPSTHEPAAAVSAARAAAEKRAIGAAAAAMIAPGASVIFDSSSTVAAAASAVLARRIPLTAVTNDLAIGQMLAAGELVRVLVPGGSVRPGSTTLLGEPGPTFWADIRADMALIGAHAVADGWLTDTALDVAAAKRAMIAAARRVLVLVDGAKFAPPTFCRIAPVSAAQVLITDAGAPVSAVEALRDNGVEVSVVDMP